MAVAKKKHIHKPSCLYSIPPPDVSSIASEHGKEAGGNFVHKASELLLHLFFQDLVAEIDSLFCS